MNYFRLFMLIILCLCTTMLFCSTTETADLVLRGGKVITVDEEFSIQESVAIKDGKFIYVGNSAGVEPYIGPQTKVIELNGLTVLPGLIDAHAHLHSLGNELANLKITGSKSWSEIVNKVAERVKTAEPGEWILGGRWDQNQWDIKKFPVHDELSRVSPDNPVYLRRVDGNSAFVNAKALELAGITRDTPNPTGGVIHKRPNGEPSGVLVNRAMNIVLAKMPADSEEYRKDKFLSAVESCISVGLTGIHEAGVTPVEINMYKKLIDDGQLDLRVYAMFGEQEKPVLEGDLEKLFAENRIDNYGDHFLSVRSIKLFFDGALGSRGAAFYEPYSDDPNNNGLLRISTDYLYEVSKAALKTGMGVNTHCIGIRGNRLCLEAYEKALKENPVENHRFRIEHSQIVRREDVDKFVELGVIPAMQPTHCTSDMFMVKDRVGENRAEGAYAWRWFLDAGLKIPAGSDFPVESNNPMYGIYSSITRQNHAGEPAGGWHPEQSMTREEAIKSFTIWAAYGAFQEEVLGSIEVGKLADITVLDKDILTVNPEEILTTNAVYTIVAGKVRFERK